MYSLPFCFSCYGAHRDLHSFPTRRSSDLHRPDARPASRTTAPSAGHLPCRPDDCPVGRVSTLSAGRRRTPAPPTSPPDRKSTRLNSSHVKISYAVFCLKKKKKRVSSSDLD